MLLDEFFVNLKSTLEADGFFKLYQNIDKSEDKVSKFSKTIQNKVFQAISFGGLVAGLDNISKKFEDMSLYAKNTKINIEGLQKLQNLGSISLGVDQSQVANALMELSDISRRVNMGLAMPFGGMGGTIDPVKLFERIQKATDGMSYNAKKTYLEFNKLPMGLLNLLNQSKEQMERMSKINILSNNDINSLGKFTESWKYLKAQIISVKDNFFASIGIEITRTIEIIGNFIGELVQPIKIIATLFSRILTFFINPILGSLQSILKVVNDMTKSLKFSNQAMDMLSISGFVLLGLFTKIGRVFAKWTLIFAVIEDFVEFLKGNDKTFFGNLDKFIPELIKQIEESIPKIVQLFEKIGEYIIPIITTIITDIIPAVLKGLATGVKNSLFGSDNTSKSEQQNKTDYQQTRKFIEERKVMQQSFMNDNKQTQNTKIINNDITIQMSMPSTVNGRDFAKELKDELYKLDLSSQF